MNDGSTHRFECKVSDSPLSTVWATVPLAEFRFEVTGLSDEGNRLVVPGKGQYYRAIAFDGPNYEPVLFYDKSARKALDNLSYKDYLTIYFC